jgi:hypothetical protein
MNEPRKRFVDELLAADAPSPDARARYEAEVRAMLDETLTPRERRMYLLNAVVSFLMGVGIAWAATFKFPLEPPPLTHFISAILAANSLASLAIAGLFFRGFWKGVVKRRSSRGWAAGVGVAYLGMLGWLFLLMGQYVPERLQHDVRVFGLVLLVYAAVAWVRHGVTQAEARMTEKLLEVELRLAQIGEALGPRPPHP